MASLKALQGSVSWTLYYFMSSGEDVLSAAGHCMQRCLVQSHAQWSCSCLDCGQTELEPTTLQSSIKSSEPQRAIRMQVSSGRHWTPNCFQWALERLHGSGRPVVCERVCEWETLGSALGTVKMPQSSVFGLWEEAEATGEDPHVAGEHGNRMHDGSGIDLLAGGP